MTQLHLEVSNWVFGSGSGRVNVGRVIAGRVIAGGKPLIFGSVWVGSCSDRVENGSRWSRVQVVIGPGQLWVGCLSGQV